MCLTKRSIDPVSGQRLGKQRPKTGDDFCLVTAALAGDRQKRGCVWFSRPNRTQQAQRGGTIAPK